MFALRRARALAEKKEVEVRSELGTVREQVRGGREEEGGRRRRSSAPSMQFLCCPISPYVTLISPPRCIQLDGMSVEHYRAWQREHAGLKGKLVQVRYILYMRYIKGESPPHRMQGSRGSWYRCAVSQERGPCTQVGDSQRRGSHSSEAPYLA